MKLLTFAATFAGAHVYEKSSKAYLLSLLQSITLPELPAVVVFKDGGYFTYDGESFLFVL